MKITVDEKVCLKHKLTDQEALIALAMRAGKYEKVIQNMISREILVEDNGQLKVTQHWSEVIDDILSSSSKEGSKSDEELFNLAQKMRELYPQGKMRDRYGRPTPYYYRCNNSEVIKKLKKFFTIFGNISDEEILDATKRYVASFQGNYTGMRLIKYFILKDDVKPSEDGQGHVEQISDLATFLENKENEEKVENTQEDWQRYARN